MSTRKRYAQVGLGGRSGMFRTRVFEKNAETCEMVGFCDNNRGRLKLAVAEAAEKGAAVPGYAAEDFDRMVAETKPDVVIVTTRDCHHDEYICRAMELGCDVITEKPMTTDEKKCARILETKKKTGRKCTVTFNYRYSPPRSQVKELLMSGIIGNVLAVTFNWVLDTRHGADYFRRWHRNKKNSGSLLVHKATHHFDLVNWWLSDIPETVHADGFRKFYTPETAARYGLNNRGERCLDCPEKERCPFMLDISGNERLKVRYLDNEEYDGYQRDRCVFNPENGKAFDSKVDIEDNMSVRVRYAGGAMLTYSLIAYSPWEGYFITFSGTKGRLEHRMGETSYVNSDGSVPGELVKKGTYIRLFPHFGTPYDVELATAKGGHGGADPVMLDYIFDPDNAPEDKLLRAADERSGAYSILCGVAGNHSILTGKTIRIADLVKGIEMPDYPAMPTEKDQLPLPLPKSKKE